MLVSRFRMETDWATFQRSETIYTSSGEHDEGVSIARLDDIGKGRVVAHHALSLFHGLSI